MRRALITCLAMGMLSLLPGPAPAASRPEDYLTEDGYLKNTLEIYETWGTFRSLQLTIAPSGEWVSVYQNSLTGGEPTVSSGQVSKAGLAALAREMARYDLSSLRNCKSRPRGRRHGVLIQSGRVDVGMVLGENEPIPAPDVDTMPGRFGGIVRAARASLKR